MESFRSHLQQEFIKRSKKNSAYSLRAYANALGINHATLSSILSGKRNLTPASLKKLANALNLGPAEIKKYLWDREIPKTKSSSTYHTLEQDAFNAISDWYFDAILELSLIPNFKLEPKIIAQAIDIPVIKAKFALETLERLDLLYKDKSDHYKIQHQNSTNILDPDLTSSAQKKYQQAILAKSMESIDKTDRKERDHTSTTLAINNKDIKKVKQLIQNFRHELTAYVQRPESKANSVYQLQVGFFPLTNNKNIRSKK